MKALWAAIASIVLIASVALPVSSAVAADPTCPQQPNKIPSALSTVPVIYVHGWLGSAEGSAKAVNQLEDALGRNKYSVYAFDYSWANTTWGAESAVAGCLAAYINQAADASRNGGGPGKAIAVAHSMGGVAVRAASGLLTEQHSESALAGLVTLGTPHQGSPFSGNYATTFEWVQRLQGKHPPMPAPDSSASKCLAWPRPSDCAAVPYLPAGTKIATIGGQMTVQIKLFDLQPFPSADAPVGDSIVRLNSAWGYLGSAPGNAPSGGLIGMDQVPCTISTSYINYRTLTFGGPLAAGLDMWTDYGALDQLIAGKAGIRGAEWVTAINIAGPSCAHGNLPTNQQVTNLAAKYVRQMATTSSTTAYNGSAVDLKYSFSYPSNWTVSGPDDHLAISNSSGEKVAGVDALYVWGLESPGLTAPVEAYSTYGGGSVNLQTPRAGCASCSYHVSTEIVDSRKATDKTGMTQSTGASLGWPLPVVVTTSLSGEQAPPTSANASSIAGIAVVHSGVKGANGDTSRVIIFSSQRYFATVEEAKAWMASPEHAQVEKMIASIHVQ